MRYLRNVRLRALLRDGLRDLRQAHRVLREVAEDALEDARNLARGARTVAIYW